MKKKERKRMAINKERVLVILNVVGLV